MAVGIHIHGSSFTDFASKHPRIVAASLRSANTVFTLTDATTDAVRTNGSGVRRVLRVPNAVAIPSEWPRKSDLILFAGEVGWRKGADVLLDAWKELAPQHEGWVLVVAGPVTMDLAPYEDIPNVIVPGSLPHFEVAKLQAQASIAVLPSRGEALPMFLLESMAQRCAIVATDVGSVANLLEGAGIVVDTGSTAQFATALRKVIDDDCLRADMSEKSLMKIRNEYSSDRCASTLEDEWIRMDSTTNSARACNG
ncbi:glycosyltransferase family 4 protein [Williamsia sp. 1135]|uniref:glycosyltransferase family 4 protein n=1 Tax=Williamsia sp. 1135 TaxID=1889262 RepID=UPI001439027D|nr:glycosyltransferase family 4 protein [Williamsia sp. 1135]